MRNVGIVQERRFHEIKRGPFLLFNYKKVFPGNQPVISPISRFYTHLEIDMNKLRAKFQLDTLREMINLKSLSMKQIVFFRKMHYYQEIVDSGNNWVGIFITKL